MIRKNRQKIRKLILLISIIWYPITYYLFSPDLLLFGASEGIIAADVIVFSILFLFSFFGGRLFCG